MFPKAVAHRAIDPMSLPPASNFRHASFADAAEMTGFSAPDRQIRTTSIALALARSTSRIRMHSCTPRTGAMNWLQ